MAAKNVYEAIGYNQKSIGFGQRPAIVVVDFQRAFLDEAYPLGRSPRIHAAARQTRELLAVAREKGIPIFYTVVAYRPDGSDLGWWKADLRWITLGSEAAEVSPLLDPQPDEPVIVKKAPSAFFGTELLNLLLTRHIDTVIVTGCVTSGCIRATIIDSFSYGFRTIVPEECVGDHTEEQHRANLFDVHQRYADVLPVKEVLAHLRSL